MTALRLLLLMVLWDEGLGGSENGPRSFVCGESTMMVAAVESRIVDPDTVIGDVSVASSDRFVLLLLSLLTLPTRTTMARAGVAVWVLALFKNVEPTLKVLFAGLGGRTTAYFS